MSEQKLKLLPIGTSDWSEIRSKDYLFVDKTAFLPIILLKRKLFIARPEHMGKTTLCSMLAALFTHGVRAFEGTKLPTDQLRNLGPYPVIRLSFSEVIGDDEATFEQSLITTLGAAYSAAGFAAEAAECKRVAAGSLDRFLKKLAVISVKHHLVFLIDDWSDPLTSTKGNETKHQAAEQVLKQFYAWLGRLRHIRFILVTGTLAFWYLRQLPIQDIRDFSGDQFFASVLGYTHEELVTCFAPYIAEAARRRGESPEELLAALKTQYDHIDDYDKTRLNLYSPEYINQFFAQILPEYSPASKALGA